MGFLYQLPAIVGGTVLVIERIESQNFQPGVFGWAIYANGDAEFNNVVIRGELIVGSDPGQHIKVGENSGVPGVYFYTGQATEVDPGSIGPEFTGANNLTTTIKSPVHSAVPGGFAAELILATNSGGFRTMDFNGDHFALSNVNPTVFIDVDWTALTLSGTWVDAAGARAHYTRDESGRVSLRGQVSGGGAGTQICVLPPGNRPTQSMEWIMRAQGGVVLCAVLVATTGIVTVTANLASASATGIRLDSITFPTH